MIIYIGNLEIDFVINLMVMIIIVNIGKNIYVCSLVLICVIFNLGLFLFLKIVCFCINYF